MVDDSPKHLQRGRDRTIFYCFGDLDESYLKLELAL